MIIKCLEVWSWEPSGCYQSNLILRIFTYAVQILIKGNVTLVIKNFRDRFSYFFSTFPLSEKFVVKVEWAVLWNFPFCNPSLPVNRCRCSLFKWKLIIKTFFHSLSFLRFFLRLVFCYFIMFQELYYVSELITHFYIH